MGVDNFLRELAVKSVREEVGEHLLVLSIGRLDYVLCAGGRANGKEERLIIQKGEEIIYQGEGMKADQ